MFEFSYGQWCHTGNALASAPFTDPAYGQLPIDLGNRRREGGVAGANDAADNRYVVIEHAVERWRLLRPAGPAWRFTAGFSLYQLRHLPRLLAATWRLTD